ncbi:hypothetical protein BC833DRAFT_602975 [Globomyces pollinis-pini]|nr:hypothetical protein BC833DRAFT_602975 [Globomyces pollinis-pini]
MQITTWSIVVLNIIYLTVAKPIHDSSLDKQVHFPSKMEYSNKETRNGEQMIIQQHNYRRCIEDFDRCKKKCNGFGASYCFQYCIRNRTRCFNREH